MLPSRFFIDRDPTFRFDEEPHLYWLREQTLWSATGMLKAVGYVDDRFFTADSADRGRRRHKATQIVDMVGANQLASIAQEDVPFVEAWEHFVREWNFRPRLIETPLYHPLYKFGVTPDREGLTDHPAGLWRDQPTVVEIKTGLMMWWTKIQTALQEITLQAWDEGRPVLRRRVGVRLDGSGKYEAHVYDDFNDYAVAQCVAGACMGNENRVWKQAREQGYQMDSELI